MPANLVISDDIPKADCREVCNDILSKLPDWFGPYDVYEEYLDDLAARPVFIANKDNNAVGIMVLTRTAETKTDIHLIAVRPEHHGNGIGRNLIENALAFARANGANYLTVKTLGPSRENAAYAKTLKFYESQGFLPIEEFIDFWGEGYPMLLLCRNVD